jgi:hypothetical protein
MSWDNNHPVLPFDCDSGIPLRWVPWSQGNESAIIGKSEDGLDIYENGRYHSYVFRPFKRVQLSLRYVGYGRGISAVYFRFMDEDENPYYIGLSELDELLKLGYDVSTITATFTACKHGESYGLRIDELEGDCA